MSVGDRCVHVVSQRRGTIIWTGRASYSDLDELASAIARLLRQAATPPVTVRVVLERAIVQVRSICPAPPLKSAAARHYVELETQRLFRKNGVPLVTDAVVVTVDGERRVLWAAAVLEPVARAVLHGCNEAGVTVEAMGPAADVLSRAVVAHESAEIVVRSEGRIELLSEGRGGVWRSRLLAGGDTRPTPLVPALAELGADGEEFASAYGAALVMPRLALFPNDHRAARAGATRHRIATLGALSAALWVLAGVIYLGRLLLALHGADNYLLQAHPALDSALAIRRQLDMGQGTLNTIETATLNRSRDLELLGQVTAALTDSVFLVAFERGRDATVRVSGYARHAARIAADLERARDLGDVQLEGSITRESPDGRTAWERFTVVARYRRGP